MQVAEIFDSIEGESFNSGKLTTFVRFAGCNLKCSYCDTKWANEVSAKKLMPVDEVLEQIKDATNITLTGGEPLLQVDLKELIIKLTRRSKATVNIETNGSLSIQPYVGLALRKEGRLRFSVDYKFGKMFDTKNIQYLTKRDALKFVIEDECYDLEEFMRFWKRQSVGCKIYISPCFGVSAGNIVEKLKNFSKALSGVEKYDFESKVRFQLQIHKYIWNPEKRGV